MNPPNLRREPRRSGVDIPVDRLPPHAFEAEQAVLGCVLLDPVATVDAIRREIKTTDIFYEIRHRIIWEIIIEKVDGGLMADVLTVVQALKDRNQLETVGGIDYVSKLPETTPSAENLMYYLPIVIGKYILRRIISETVQLSSAAHEQPENAIELLDQSERQILNIRRTIDNGKISHVADMVSATIDSIEDDYTSTAQITGLPTGYWELDRMLDGMEKGDMIVMAARPSVGKTSLAMNIVENVSVHGGDISGVFSLEMTKEAVSKRLIYSVARVDSRGAREKRLTDADFLRFGDAKLKLLKCKIFIDDTSGISDMEFKAKARRMVQDGAKLLVIDYIQLMNTTKKCGESRNAELTHISSVIKGVAKELKIPVIVLAQLNRNIEKGAKPRRPTISDIKDCGAIEQDADKIILLYSPVEESDNESIRKPDIASVDVIVGKNRNGSTGIVQMQFFKAFTRFDLQGRIHLSDMQVSAPSVEAAEI